MTLSTRFDPDAAGLRRQARFANQALRLTALALLSAVLLAGCGSGDENKSSNKPNFSLKNGDKVEESEAAAAAKVVQVGDFGDLPGDGRVSVTAMKVGGDDLGPWLEVSMRVENASNETAGVPDTGIVCTGSSDQGGYQADSTLLLSDEIPAGSFKEGILNLMVPGDSRTGEPAMPCTAPAFVQITGEDSQTFETTAVRVPIAEDVIAELNAKLNK
jgi:hypothetical protein